jgi:hypothetical protein
MNLLGILLGPVLFFALCLWLWLQERRAESQDRRDARFARSRRYVR